MGRIVLATASQTRIKLLANAGISFTAKSAPINERTVEQPLIKAGKSPAAIAEALAEAKALALPDEPRDTIVLGADQTLDFDARPWTKPQSIEEARKQLLALSGKTHRLHSAIVAARAGKIIWRHCDTAELTMCSFSGEFADRYLAKVGEAALTSVGAYQIEGPGLQLFERIEGDYFTILGLPLLPLLAFLRREGEIEG
jgi:septum formation protein